ncbi:MAG: tRNA pseudouridine(55) synthase TruB [Phycisphaerales bacterium]|nr:tRNA pseudouridine(55) synthase TruB [Phycisphaerales bacterium]
MEPISGILNVNKPAGLSSARVVGQIKRLLPPRTKVGHAGTLDPFATGVLLVLVGKATRWCEQLMGQPKQYIATVKLGATTATLDPESPEQPADPPVDRPEESQVLEVLQRFVGEIQQVPPQFSALKIAGRPAYQLARRGESLNLPPRTVRIDRMELLGYQWPTLNLRVDCGRGTYIRSIARDVGQILAGGGYLTTLCRTRIGRFDLQQAVSLQQLAESGVVSFLHSAIEP